MTLKSSHEVGALRAVLAVTVVSTTLLLVSSLSYVTGFAPKSSCSTTTSFGLMPSSTTTLFSSSTATTVGAAPNLKSILKKPSKVLTVGVELETTTGKYLGDDKNELSILSMQLRKSKVSSIWVSSPSSSSSSSSTTSILKTIVAEQKTSQGNFPGPVPVIYDGSSISDSNIPFAELASIGVSAVALTTGHADNLQEADLNQGGNMMEIIWKVSSVADVEDVMKRTGDEADAFLLDIATSGSTIDSLEDVAEALPSTCLRILSVDAMQPDGKEVEDAKKSKVDLGCNSILVRRACVGDTEDLEYTQFVVGGMTSKASSEFKFSGLTGSTNGHFGGIQQNQKISWRRQQ